MSGGHFDYEDRNLISISGRLKYDMETSEDSEILEHQDRDELLDAVSFLSESCKKLGLILKSYDYAISGDSSFCDFLENYRLYKK